jgi:alpha/beta superfamily hydrolase
MTTRTATLRLNGTVERTSFLGERGEALYVCLHEPAGVARGLVVLCSSIGAEWKYNYRREVLLARLLAAGGMAAVRFHYLGTGNSDDGTADFTRMVSDARLVEQWAAETAGVPLTAYFGAKFGAFVAAAAGTSAPLVAWSAPRTGTAYFKELFRIAHVGLLAAGGTEADGAVGPWAELANGQSADVVGYDLHASLYESAVNLSFLAELGSPPRPVRLVDVGTAQQAGQRLGEHAAELADHGFEVSTACFAGDGSWWLNHAGWVAEESRESVRELLADTASSLLAALPDGLR